MSIFSMDNQFYRTLFNLLYIIKSIFHSVIL